MKKLLLIALMTIGFFTLSNAQMFYTITNNSPYNVDFKMGDSGPVNGVYYPLITANGGVQTGTFTSPLIFPLAFGSTNALGCTAFQSVAGAPSAGTVPFTCFVISTMSHTLQQFGFFYVLNVTIN